MSAATPRRDSGAGIEKFINLHASPYAVFDALGGFAEDSAWDDVYKMIEEAPIRYYRYLQGAYDILGKFAGRLNDYSKGEYELPLYNTSGEKVKLSKAVVWEGGG